MQKPTETTADTFHRDGAPPPQVPVQKSNKRGILPPLSATTVGAILVVSDSLALLLSGFILYDRIVVYSPLQNYYWTATAFVWLVTLSILNFGRLYLYDVAINPLTRFKMFVIVVATAFLFLLAVAFSIDIADDLSRRWVGYFAAVSTTFLVFNRVLVSQFIRRAQLLENSRRNMAIIGTGEQAKRMLAAIDETKHQPLSIAGVYEPYQVQELSKGKKKAKPDSAIEGLKAGGVQALMQSVRAGHVDDVLIALPWAQDEKIIELLDQIRELPVNVYLASDLVGFRTEFKSPPSHFGRLPILQVVGKPLAGWDSIIKALEDFILAILVFILVAPIMLVIAICVKLDSKGPVFFRQKRLGFNNQVFYVYKFRTMYHQQVAPQQTRQAQKGDSRVTRIGRFLRRSSLDELPQIFNVLSGTMSIVGPRPHALDHNEEFAKRTKGYFARHRVKPGITGLAQVKGYRGETDTHEKLEGRIRNDNFYAENWSLSLDIWILIRTVVITIWGKNAY
jgi:putative colanic acid biosysnthesis UDP-glucose lipid carrier transferase